MASITPCWMNLFRASLRRPLQKQTITAVPEQPDSRSRTSPRLGTSRQLTGFRTYRGVGLCEIPALSVPRPPSGRDCVVQGKADAPQQVLKTWVGPQAVHARIYVKIDKPVRVLFVGFLQVLNHAVVFSQAGVDSGEEVRCNIFFLC